MKVHDPVYTPGTFQVHVSAAMSTHTPATVTAQHFSGLRKLTPAHGKTHALDTIISSRVTLLANALLT